MNHRDAIPAALVAALLAAAGGCSREPAATASAAARAKVAVRTHLVTPAPFERELVAVGSLRADESVTVASEIAGRLVRIGFSEGRPVKAGTVLFELDDSIYRAEVEQARANLVLSRRSAERAEELFARKLISAQDRDQAVATLQVNEAALQLAEARLSKTRITAPFDGIGGLRLVSPGTYVAAGQPLTMLEAITRMKLDFSLPELALSALAVGQRLQVEIDALPGERFEGEVYAIDPRVSDQTRSIGVRAHVSNDAGRLRPGLFARVRLAVERQADAILIPEEAILPRGEQLFVYVIKDGSARLREVKVGERQPGRAQIVSGLRPGEAVAVSGLQRLSDDSAVTVEHPVPTQAP